MYARQPATGGGFVNTQNRPRLAQPQPVEIIQLHQQTIFGGEFPERLRQGLLNVGRGQLAGQSFFRIRRRVKDIQGLLLAT